MPMSQILYKKRSMLSKVKIIIDREIIKTMTNQSTASNTISIHSEGNLSSHLNPGARYNRSLPGKIWMPRSQISQKEEGNRCSRQTWHRLERGALSNLSSNKLSHFKTTKSSLFSSRPTTRDPSKILTNQLIINKCLGAQAPE